MIAVFKVFSVIEGELISGGGRSQYEVGAVGVLTSMEYRGSGPGWTVPLTIGKGPGRRQMDIPLKPFVTDDEYERSFAEPFPFSACGPALDDKLTEAIRRSLWLYRDAIYMTERSPKPSEMDEVVLRIKALHFQSDKAMRRLSEQVANFEAVEGQLRAGRGQGREPIPDDVKLLVWARDGGVCVGCGSAKELQFDHVIPLARGGSNEAANLQILCRACNQAKGERLV